MPSGSTLVPSAEWKRRVQTPIRMSSPHPFAPKRAGHRVDGLIHDTYVRAWQSCATHWSLVMLTGELLRNNKEEHGSLGLLPAFRVRAA